MDDCTVDLKERHVDIDTHARGHCQFDGIGGTRSKHFHTLCRDGQIASQELAFGPTQFQPEDKVVPVFPGVILQKRSGGYEIFQSGGVGCGTLGSVARDEVQFSYLVALIF
jgi:hypothetical protein